MDLRLMVPMIWKDPVRVIPGWDAPSAAPGWPRGGDGELGSARPRGMGWGAPGAGTPKIRAGLQRSSKRSRR